MFLVCSEYHWCTAHFVKGEVNIDMRVNDWFQQMQNCIDRFFQVETCMLNIHVHVSALVDKYCAMHLSTTSQKSMQTQAENRKKVKKKDKQKNKLCRFSINK